MSDEEQTKGGHAPAEKIGGGIRIARKERVTSSSGGDSTNNQEEKAPNEEESYELEKRGDRAAEKAYIKQIKKDFPTEGTKVFHEKPHPTREPPHQYNSAHKQHQDQLFQPRKN